jgi:hypothetical protein
MGQIQQPRSTRDPNITSGNSSDDPPKSLTSEDSQKAEIKRRPWLIHGKQVAGLAILAWEGRQIKIREGRSKQSTEYVVEIPVPLEFKRREPAAYRVLFGPKGTSWINMFRDTYAHAQYGRRSAEHHIEIALRAAFFTAIHELMSNGRQLFKDEKVLAQLDKTLRSYEAWAHPKKGQQRSLKLAIRLARCYDATFPKVKWLRSQEWTHENRTKLGKYLNKLVPPRIAKCVVKAIEADIESQDLASLFADSGLENVELTLAIVKCKQLPAGTALELATIHKYVRWARGFLRAWERLPSE